MKNLMVGILLVSMVLFINGCSIFESISKSNHETKATSADLAVSLDKLSAAIEKTLPKTGYSANKTKDTVLEKEFEGEGIDVTAKKIDDNNSKIYVRVGFAGDNDKQATILAEIKKELGLK